MRISSQSRSAHVRVVDVHVLLRGRHFLPRRPILELRETIAGGISHVRVIPVQHAVDPPPNDAVARGSWIRFPLVVDLDAMPFARIDERGGCVWEPDPLSVRSPFGIHSDAVGWARDPAVYLISALMIVAGIDLIRARGF